MSSSGFNIKNISGIKLQVSYLRDGKNCSKFLCDKESLNTDALLDSHLNGEKKKRFLITDCDAGKEDSAEEDNSSDEAAAREEEADRREKAEEEAAQLEADKAAEKEANRVAQEAADKEAADKAAEEEAAKLEEASKEEETKEEKAPQAEEEEAGVTEVVNELLEKTSVVEEDGSALGTSFDGNEVGDEVPSLDDSVVETKINKKKKKKKLEESSN